jgi:transcriptional regulator with XRE-family HTH domain
MSLIDKSELGKRLAHLPRLLGINSRQIAIGIGADPSYYNRAERGRGLSGNYIEALIQRFNISKNWLLLGEGQPIKSDFVDGRREDIPTILDTNTNAVYEDPIFSLPVSDAEKVRLYNEKIQLLKNEVEFWKRIAKTQQEILDNNKR